MMVLLLYLFRASSSCLQAGAGDDQEHPALRSLPREVREVSVHLPDVWPGWPARGLLKAVCYPRRDLHAAVPG